MDLGNYLRGLGPRANPTADPGGRWRLEWRHAEGGAWAIVGEAVDEAGARDELASSRGAYGDVFRLLTPTGTTRRVWVVGRQGPIDAGTVPRPTAWNGPGLGRKDWVFAWEAPRRSASAMVQAIEGVDRRRLVRVGCDCGDAVLDLLPPGEDLPRRMVALARAWTRDEATEEAVRRLAARCLDLSVRDLSTGGSLMGSIAHVAWMVGSAVSPLREGRPLTEPARTRYAPTAAEGVLNAVNGLRCKWRPTTRTSAAEEEATAAQSDRDQAAFVRRHVPLSVALLARAGEPTPLELGF